MRATPALASALAWLAACSTNAADPEAREPERVLLAPADLFRELAPPEDPFPEHRPAAFLCHPLTGFYVEGGYLEVNTGSCAYFATGQPALAGAAAGDRVVGRVRHFDLTAAEPSEAHLAVTWGDLTLTETRLSIPSPAAVLDFELTLPRDVAQGDLVALHLHNHGQNTYQFEPLWLEPAP